MSTTRTATVTLTAYNLGPDATWTYEGYWNAVVGLGTPAQAVEEHGLVPAGLDSFASWLDEAESIARTEGHLAQRPAEWSAYQRRAAEALQAAAGEVQS